MTTKEQELEQLAKECFAEMLNDQHTFVPTIIKKYLQSATADLRAEVERGRQRVAGDGSENCIFCATISGTGHAQDVPMCRLCELESQLATERERVKELVKHGSAIIPHLEVSHEADAFQSLIESLTTPPSAKEETK
jgi:hypothetical protein